MNCKTAAGEGWGGGGGAGDNLRSRVRVYWSLLNYNDPTSTLAICIVKLEPSCLKVH